MTTVFLLSPARCGGERAGVLAASSCALGVQLRGPGAPVGDVFAWLSALYFRGKLTYARAFGTALVMAPGRGLCPPETPIGAADLRAMGRIDVESEAFAAPVRRDAAIVATATAEAGARIVLLGSVASTKYVRTLLDVLGPRLLFPETFVGRGDMSRGGLLLRSARTSEELAYVPIQGATLRGVRPPRLPRLSSRRTPAP